MVKRITPLIFGYSVFVAALILIATYSNHLPIYYRLASAFVLFCVLMSMALLHIRSAIGNKINYIVASLSAFSITLFTAVLIVSSLFVLEHIAYGQVFFIKAVGSLSCIGLIPCLIISIFFRKSDKVVVFKNKNLSDILDAEI